MRIEILGPLRVIADDGSDVTPRGAQQRRAIAALAAADGGVSVDALEELLWPAGAPSANALQATISKLRRQLAPASIDTDRRSYTLVGVDTDVADLDRALQEERWSDVEALVSGVVLADLDGHELAGPLTARVAGAVRLARVHRIDAVLDRDPAASVAELETLVTTEPFDETWWAKLMLAHARSGRSADALQTFQRARTVLADELGLEPGPTLRQLEAQILAGDVPGSTPAVDRPRIRLPHRVGSFIGRESELADLARAVDRHRLVTVVGPGGAGKTTTVLELGHRVGRDAAFAQLADAEDRDGVVRMIARSIGLPDGEQSTIAGVTDVADPLDRIRDVLRDRPAMLVLDNCEHVVDHAAEVAHEILTACAAVAIVATSRASLGVVGEHVYPLPPLPTADAVELFVDRAGDHGVDVDPSDRGVLAVCDRLDGLPLAIELAAARVRSMSVAELEAGLDDRFALLSAGPRTAERRQQTLRAVVDWSHDLLTHRERVVFRRLAAFVGGANAACARVVCSGRAEGEDIAESDVPLILDRLVDQSLVRADRTSEGLRFSMLQTLTDYAAERLAESGERDAVRLRHAQCFADDFESGLRDLIGHDQPRWFAKAATERGNLDAALATAIERSDAQLALEVVVPVSWYFFMAGELQSGTEALGAALAVEGPSDVLHRSIALATYSWLLSNGPDLERALATSADAMGLLDRLDDPFAKGMIVNTRVMTLLFSGNLGGVEATTPLLDELGIRSPDRWIRAMSRVVKAEYAQFRGRIPEADALFAEALVDFEAEGDRFAYALTITEGSELAEVAGDYDRAVELLTHGIELAAEVGFSGHPLAMRARLGNVEILRGNLDAAERHHRGLVEEASTSGVPWLRAMAELGLSAIARRRGDFETAERHLDAAWDLPRSRAVPYMRSIIQVARGYLADEQGHRDAALSSQADGFDIAVQIGAPRGIAYSFEGVAGALALSGDRAHLALAARLLGQSDTIRRGTGGPMPAGERYDVDRAETRLRHALGDQVFEAEFATGAAAAVDDLVGEVRDLTRHVAHA